MTKRARTNHQENFEPVSLPPERKRGRPTDFDEDMAVDAAAMARQGATDREIAAQLGITTTTIYVWMRRYPYFADAIKQGKVYFDERVERSLGVRAIGYEQSVEKVFANGTRMTVVEQVPPDTVAQIFWLKNRRRADWKDRHETEIVVPERDASEPSVRELALAALALIADAAYTAGDDLVIEHQVQPEEPQDDDTDFAIDD